MSLCLTAGNVPPLVRSCRPQDGRTSIREHAPPAPPALRSAIFGPPGRAGRQRGRPTISGHSFRQTHLREWFRWIGNSPLFPPQSDHGNPYRWRGGSMKILSSYDVKMCAFSGGIEFLSNGRREAGLPAPPPPTSTWCALGAEQERSASIFFLIGDSSVFFGSQGSVLGLSFTRF